MTDRLNCITSWLKNCLPNFLKLETLAGDAGARKYYRVGCSDSSYILMDTALNAELLNYIKIGSYIGEVCSIPKIIAQDLEQGLLLLEDFGDQTYLTALQRSTTQEQINDLYHDAIHALARLQGITADLQLNMGPEYIAQQLDVFHTWYIKKHLQLEPDLAIAQELQDLFLQCFSEQPQVFVHADYHCRNLMVIEKNNPGILDFQDAICGPLTYDLVSLFQDAYISWPREQVETWVAQFATMHDIKNLDTLIRQFDITGLQRHLKNLGVFARLHHRDTKSVYLKSIPSLLNYINATCARYPELSNLKVLMQKLTEITIKEAG